MIRRLLDALSGPPQSVSVSVPAPTPATSGPDRRIWTARHWLPAMSAAITARDETAVAVLREHALYADHCGHYEVAAWPCPAAAAELDRLRGDLDADRRAAI